MRQERAGAAHTGDEPKAAYPKSVQPAPPEPAPLGDLAMTAMCSTLRVTFELEADDREALMGNFSAAPRRRMKRKSKRKQPAAATNPDAVYIETKPGDDRAALLAQAYLRPSIHAATLVREFNRRSGDDGGPALTPLIAELQRHTVAIAKHDLGRAEGMLIAQAHALDSIFAAMARIAACNMYEQRETCETYLRLGLKAQAQCARTLEVLGALKNPLGVAFVRQANIGQAVQVNNAAAPGTPSGARKTEMQKSKLLETLNGERVDSATTRAAIGTDPQLAPVGKINRSENSDREGSRIQERLQGRHLAHAS